MRDINPLQNSHTLFPCISPDRIPSSILSYKTWRVQRKSFPLLMALSPIFPHLNILIPFPLYRGMFHHAVKYPRLFLIHVTETMHELIVMCTTRFIVERASYIWTGGRRR